MRPLFLHIGMEKTGTTFLQFKIFPYLENISFHGIRNSKSPLYNELIDISDNDLDKESIDHIKTTITKVASAEKNLLSHESLSGNFTRFKPKPFSSIMDDLVSLLSDYDTKIILCIRNQNEMLSSSYCQYISEGGTKDYIDYLKDIDLDRLKYSLLIDEMIHRFGKDNLHLCQYEDFREDKKKFLRNMLGFMGEDKIPLYSDKKINSSLGKEQLGLYRIYNRYQRSIHNPDGIIPQLPILWYNKKSLVRRLLSLSSRLYYTRFSIDRHKKKEIFDFYLQDNIKVKDKYIVDLNPLYTAFDAGQKT